MTLTFKKTDYISDGSTQVIHETVELTLPDSEWAESITLHIVPDVEPRPTDRQASLQKLVELSSDDASLDWQQLSRVNIEAWGADADSE